MVFKVESNIVSALSQDTIKTLSYNSEGDDQAFAINLKVLHDIDEIQHETKNEEQRQDMDRLDLYLSDIVIDEAVEAVEVEMILDRSRFGSGIDHDILMEIETLEMDRQVEKDINAIKNPVEDQLTHGKSIIKDASRRGHVRGSLPR